MVNRNGSKTSNEAEFQNRITQELNKEVLSTHSEIENPTHSNRFAVILPQVYSKGRSQFDNQEEPEIELDEELK